VTLSFPELKTDEALLACDIDKEFGRQSSSARTICINTLYVQQTYHIPSPSCSNTPTNSLDCARTLPLTSQSKWRLATKVHAQATTAARTQTAATTTQETHATPATHDPAAKEATPAIALPTLPAAAAEAATHTEAQTATIAKTALALPIAPPTMSTTTTHANVLPHAHHAAHPTPAIANLSKLKNLPLK
jgi:hypothetical protein